MGEISIFGVYVAPMVAYLLIAAVVYLVVSVRLPEGWVDKYFGHPDLIHVCLFFVILSLVVILALI